MKKSLLFAGICLGAMHIANAQIFSENFNGVPLSGGTGTLPAGWAQYNVDGKTPAANVSFMGSSAWVVRAVSGNNAATSTSWYNPVGASDDWMVTPAITIPATGNPYLKFKEYAPDANFPDGYRVFISSSGNTVADFTNPPVLTVGGASSSGFTSKLVNLQSFMGQTIYIAFQNNSNDKFLLYIDDVEVLDLPAYDARLNSISLPRYGVVNTNTSLSMNVSNDGYQTITSLTVDWNDGASHSATISGLNIAPGASANVTHSTPLNYAAVEEKNIDVNITQVNSNADAVPANNSGSRPFNSTSSAPAKGVLIEEGTGTWCGWCPRGAVAMEYMYNTYASQGFIGIAVHNQDPMTVAAYDNAANFGGYPSCNVDRAILDASVSQSLFEQYFNARKSLPVPAAITVAPTISGSDITIPVSAQFVTKFAASNFRLAVIVVEDGVTDTLSGYNQTNYYAGNAYGPMGGYESKPDPVPAAQMVYDHVGRALLGGYSGQSGSVPASINDGQNVSYTFNYTVPATSDISKIKLVALLIDQADGTVVNAKEVKAQGGVSVEEKDENAFSFNVYPNPSADFVNVSLGENKAKVNTLTVLDMSGKMVFTREISGGENLISVPVSQLANGNYLITVSGAASSYTKIFVKN